VLLCLTGAIASMHGPRLVQLLQQEGFAVRIAMTGNACRFVSSRALEALTHSQVHTDLWRHARQGMVPHIHLAEWAEVVLICPASATTLSRIARGDCSDIVSAIAIATRAPTVIVPSMNTAMLTSAAVTRNIDQLREDGFHMVQSGYGVEVADAPAHRQDRLGSAIAFEAVLDIVRFLIERPAERATE
jgi:phosphopantothenoylcysteine decarboxylase/phosphopantothenate--cysteine ligase